MRRRQFIMLLGGASASWPLTALARQAGAVGFLSSKSPGDSSHLVAAMRTGLTEGTEDRMENIAVEYRWAEGNFERLPELAVDLVRSNVAVIISSGNMVSALAAKSATSTIPIVFVVGDDPVKAGLVASLNHPGGNITGVSILGTALESKRLELLRELVPASAVGFLLNPHSPNKEQVTTETLAAARRLEQRLVILWASAESEFEGAFSRMAKEAIGAVSVGADPLFTLFRERVVALAAKHRIAAVYQIREFVDAGGLMSYGTSLSDAYRLAVVYAGRILNGASQPTCPSCSPLNSS